MRPQLVHLELVLVVPDLPPCRQLSQRSLRGSDPARLGLGQPVLMADEGNAASPTALNMSLLPRCSATGSTCNTSATLVPLSLARVCALEY